MTKGREFEAGHPLETVLDRYRTGELSAGDEGLVKDHLDACHECRDQLAELEGFAATVKRAYGAADPRVQGSEWDRRKREIAARTYRRERARVVAPRWWRAAPQLAAAAVAVIVIGVIVRSGVRGPEDVDLFGPDPVAEIPVVGEVPAEAKDAAERVGETVSAIPAEEEMEEASTAIPDREVDPGAALRHDRSELARAAPQDADEAAKARGAVQAEGARAGAEEGDRFRAMAEAEPPEEAGPLRAAVVDRRARFDELAGDALARRDSLAAVHALAFWRDSLSEDERRGNERLVAARIDSLAALAGEPPEGR